MSLFGRRPLAPDNTYHNLSFSIARELPAESRLSATAAVGLMDQDEMLLPYSFHSNALANPNLARATAQAAMRTTQAILEYTISPAPRLNVRMWARHYGLDNDTPEAPWQYVTQDTSNLNGAVSFKNKRINLAYASNRTNTGPSSHKTFLSQDGFSGTADVERHLSRITILKPWVGQLH